MKAFIGICEAASLLIVGSVLIYGNPYPKSARTFSQWVAIVWHVFCKELRGIWPLDIIGMTKMEKINSPAAAEPRCAMWTSMRLNTRATADLKTVRN